MNKTQVFAIAIVSTIFLFYVFSHFMVSEATWVYNPTVSINLEGQNKLGKIKQSIVEYPYFYIRNDPNPQIDNNLNFHVDYNAFYIPYLVACFYPILIGIIYVRLSEKAPERPRFYPEFDNIRDIEILEEMR